MSGSAPVEEFTCASIEEYFTFGERLVTNLMGAFDGDTNIFECFGNVLNQAAGLLEDMSQ